MIDNLRRSGLGDIHQILKGNHGSGIGADVVLANVLWMRAELFVSLNVNTIRTVIEIEIVDVGRTHVDGEGIGDLTERDVQALGFFAIDGHDILRIVRGVGAEESGKVFFFTSETGAGQVVSYFVEILEGVIALIEKFILESTELAKTLHRGRFEADDNRARNSEQLWA